MIDIDNSAEYPTVSYGGYAFARCCPICGRYVKPHKTLRFNEYRGCISKTSATCKRHGRVMMPSYGWI